MTKIVNINPELPNQHPNHRHEPLRRLAKLNFLKNYTKNRKNRNKADHHASNSVIDYSAFEQHNSN